jgi:hypothetical protein
MGQTMRGAELNDKGGAHQTPARSPLERRHSFRVQVPARASVFHKGKMCGYFAVHDVSIGGCSLSEGQPCPVGEHVDVLLQMPGSAGVGVRRSAKGGEEG